MEANVPAPSNRAKVRTWIQKLGTKEPLAFSGQDELKMLLDLYDHNPSHPIQYYFDDRFRGNLPAPDLNLCLAASEHLDEGLLRTADGGFINASCIEGKERTYIATQHPLPSTVSDFWKMVLAEKPAVVIMLNKHDYDQPQRKPDEPELVQYWPGTQKDGKGFTQSLLLEDSETGGTVKISVLPEPTTHDIEELDKLHQSPSSPNIQQISVPSNETPLTPIITTPTSPPIASHSISSPSLLPAETNTHQIVLTNGAPIFLPTNNQQVLPITSNNDMAPPVNATSNSINVTEEKPNINGKKEPKGTQGCQEYKLNNNIEYSRLHVEYLDDGKRVRMESF